MMHPDDDAEAVCIMMTTDPACELQSFSATGIRPGCCANQSELL